MKVIYSFLAVFFFLISMSSCSVIEGIFKAGVWVGVLMVVGVIALVIFLIVRLSGKK